MRIQGIDGQQLLLLLLFLSLDGNGERASTPRSDSEAVVTELPLIPCSHGAFWSQPCSRQFTLVGIGLQQEDLPIRSL